MTKQDYTHLTMIVDRSGSMSYIRNDAEGGINTLISEQKKEPGLMTMTLIEFDDKYNMVYEAKNIQEVEPYGLVPRGTTALLDAVGRGIVETGKFLSEIVEPLRPANVLVVIVTDGHENSSREYTNDQIKEMIKHQTDVYGWDFTYIGANVDAFGVGASIGVVNSIQYAANSKSTQDMYSGLTRSLSTVRAKGGTIGSNMESDFSDA